MKHNSPIALLFALVLACGAQTSETEEPDNGGRTHFLKSCASDAECGSLECLSKICTRRCDTQADCTDLDDDARCEPEGNDSALCVAAPIDASNTLSCETLTTPPVAVDIVDIDVTNERAEPLVFASPFDCSGSVYVGVESLDPASPGTAFAGSCAFSCDQVLTQPYGCNPSCPGAAPLVVDPGETVTVQWATRLGNVVPVNSECCGVPDQCPSQCTLLSAAKPGPYRATFAAAMVDATEAAACREASNLWSPLPSSPSPDTVVCQIDEAELEDVTVDFEFGAGRVALTIQ